MSLLHRDARRDPLAQLSSFREEFYASLTARSDVLFELADAVLCGDGPVRSLVGLSLVGEHRRGHGGLYAAVARGRIDTDRLREALASVPLPRAVDGRLVLAVDVTCWLRPTPHRSGSSATLTDGARTSTFLCRAGPTPSSARLSRAAAPGPHPWTHGVWHPATTPPPSPHGNCVIWSNDSSPPTSGSQATLTFSSSPMPATTHPVWPSCSRTCPSRSWPGCGPTASCAGPSQLGSRTPQAGHRDMALSSSSAGPTPGAHPLHTTATGPHSGRRPPPPLGGAEFPGQTHPGPRPPRLSAHPPTSRLPSPRTETLPPRHRTATRPEEHLAHTTLRRAHIRQTPPGEAAKEEANYPTTTPHKLKIKLVPVATVGVVSGRGHTEVMSASSSPEAHASRSSPVWVESMGGPLIVVPVSALAAWRGCTETGVIVGDATAPDDYDRARAVDDLAGVIAVGEDGAQALVLADESATSCFLPEHRAFLRWLAADSEDELTAAARAVLADPATEWGECGTWSSDGPAILMDSAESGTVLANEYPGCGMPSQASVALPAGRWRIRATHTKADEDSWVGLVQMLPIES